MNWSNYHSHNFFCDGRSSMEEFVRFAISKNVKKYGFSSHAPLPFDTFWNMKLSDFDDYISEFKRLNEKYKDEIELYLGLEIDYIHNFSEIQNNIYPCTDLNYLIGSIHYLDKLSTDDFWTIDGNFNDFSAGLNQLYDGDIRMAVERFFEISKFMLHKGGFDIIGHIDKIALNGSKCQGFDLNESWYKNLMGETLECVKQTGIIVEINTKSLIDKGFTYPNECFFPVINDLQIPIVVNSDCHYPTSIIDGFEPTFKKLKEVGFKSMNQLINGLWQPVEFNEKGLLF